jgi:hypothetical protein
MQRNALIATLALAAMSIAPLAASADPYDGYHNDRHDHGYRQGSGRPVERTGRIASVNGGSFRLQDGTTIFLNHTSINPRGVNLQSGERVYIQGTEAGNGAINASTVTIALRGERRRF